MQPASVTPLRLRERTFDAGQRAVMAIINRTTDSFYSGNRFADLDGALAAVDAALTAGADVIDIGGVRAGQQGEWVSAAEEVARINPVITVVRGAFPRVPISVDTWRSEVALAVGGLGIDLINDTWAGHDPQLVEVAARLGAGYVVSHSGGLPPRTDPVAVTYPPEPEGVIADVLRTLQAGAERAEQAGVARDSILLDPTLDFGKTTQHSLNLVRATDEIAALGYPVMQAISRKDFIGETLDLSAEERLEGSLAATAIAAWGGAVLFRTHDVQATRRVLDQVASIAGDRPPLRAERGVSGKKDKI